MTKLRRLAGLVVALTAAVGGAGQAEAVATSGEIIRVRERAEDLLAAAERAESAVKVFSRRFHFGSICNSMRPTSGRQFLSHYWLAPADL